MTLSLIFCLGSLLPSLIPRLHSQEWGYLLPTNVYLPFQPCPSRPQCSSPSSSLGNWRTCLTAEDKGSRNEGEGKRREVGEGRRAEERKEERRERGRREEKEEKGGGEREGGRGEKGGEGGKREEKCREERKEEEGGGEQGGGSGRRRRRKGERGKRRAEKKKRGRKKEEGGEDEGRGVEGGQGKKGEGDIGRIIAIFHDLYSTGGLYTCRYTPKGKSVLMNTKLQSTTNLHRLIDASLEEFRNSISVLNRIFCTPFAQ